MNDCCFRGEPCRGLYDGNGAAHRFLLLGLLREEVSSGMAESVSKFTDDDRREHGLQKKHLSDLMSVMSSEFGLADFLACLGNLL